MLTSRLAPYLSKLRNNPAYFRALATSYALLGMQVVAQILLVPLYLSHLGKAGFGSLTILLSAAAVAFLGIAWTNGGVFRVLGEAAALKDDEKFADGYWAAKYIFLSYGVVVAIGLALTGWISPQLFFSESDGGASAGFPLAILMVGLHFILLADVAVDSIALAAYHRQAVANGLLIFSLCVFLTGVILWLAGADGGVAGVFACLALGNLSIRLFAGFYWRRTIGLGFRRPSQVKVAAGRLLHFFKRGYFIYGLLFMALQSDTLLVGLLKGPHVAAEFALVWKIAELVILMLWRLSESLQPELVHSEMRGDAERLSRIYRQGIRLVRVASLAAGIAYAALGPWFIGLWVGAENAPQNPWAYVLAGGTIVWLGMARFPGFYLYSLVQLRPLIAVAAIELAVKTGLILLLIWRFDYLAPLIAINVAHCFGIAFAYARLPWRRDRTLRTGLTA